MSLIHRVEGREPMQLDEMRMIGTSAVFEEWPQADAQYSDRKARVARLAMLGHLEDQEVVALSADEGRALNELSQEVARMDRIDLEAAQEFTNLDNLTM